MYIRYRLIADTHPILRNRCLGEDVVHVVERALSVTQGLLDGGVLPVIKHTPGHGRATSDSHKELPRVSTRANILHNTDFLAFEGLPSLPLGMSAHIVFEGIDRDYPATQAPNMIKLVREDIGFSGLLMTDASVDAGAGRPAFLARATVT